MTLTEVRNSELAERDDGVLDIAVGVHITERRSIGAGGNEDLEIVVTLFTPIAHGVAEVERLRRGNGAGCRRAINDTRERTRERDGDCRRNCSEKSEDSGDGKLHGAGGVVGE